MKIELETTSQIVWLDGVQCRVWEGKTGEGVAIVAFIPRVTCKRDADQSELARELVEQDVPRMPAEVWPNWMVL
jgi:hypothetical protein